MLDPALAHSGAWLSYIESLVEGVGGGSIANEDVANSNSAAGDTGASQDDGSGAAQDDTGAGDGSDAQDPSLSDGSGADVSGDVSQASV